MGAAQRATPSTRGDKHTLNFDPMFDFQLTAARLAQFLSDMITGSNLAADYSQGLQARDKDASQKVKATADAWRSIPRLEG